MSILNNEKEVDLKGLNDLGIINGQSYWFMYKMKGELYWDLDGICPDLKEILNLDGIEILYGYSDNRGFFTRVQVSNISLETLESVIKENKEKIMSNFIEEGRELRFSNVEII